MYYTYFLCIIHMYYTYFFEVGFTLNLVSHLVSHRSLKSIRYPDLLYNYYPYYFYNLWKKFPSKCTIHWVGKLVTKHLRHCYRSQQLMTHVRGHFFLTTVVLYLSLQIGTEIIIQNSSRYNVRHRGIIRVWR